VKDPSTFTLDDIIARKLEARRQRSRMSFAEKVAIVERMREALAPFNAVRLRLQQAMADHGVPSAPAR
jgi:hypothetical protein